MAQPGYLYLSAKARDLAHGLATRENRTIAEIVERALEAYEGCETGREPAKAFYSRIIAENPIDEDVNWDELLAELRRPCKGPEF